MASIYKSVPEVFQEVFDILSANYGQDIFYDYGTIVELANKVSNQNKIGKKDAEKFPLIWYLVKDGVITEEVDNTKTNPRFVRDNTILFITNSKQEYSSPLRHQNVFNPILKPLYVAFIDTLKKCSKFQSENKFYHQCSENFNFGDVAVRLNQVVDVILLEGLDLRVIEVC